MGSLGVGNSLKKYAKKRREMRTARRNSLSEKKLLFSSLKRSYLFREGNEILVAILESG